MHHICLGSYDDFFDAYKRDRFSDGRRKFMDGLDEKESYQYLIWFLTPKKERRFQSEKLKRNYTGPSLREFFKTWVFPLVETIPEHGSINRDFAKIGLSAIGRDGGLKLICRLHYLLERSGCADLMESNNSRQMYTDINSAIERWTSNSNINNKPIPNNVMSTRQLIAWEALLVWHYFLVQSLSNSTVTRGEALCRIIYGQGYLECINLLTREHSEDTKSAQGRLHNDIEKRLVEIRKHCLESLRARAGRLRDNRVKPSSLVYRKGPVMMRLLLGEPTMKRPLTWLAIFAKCHHAAKQCSEIEDTRDPIIRKRIIDNLESARIQCLQDPSSGLVKTGLSDFANEASLPDVTLSESNRGRGGKREEEKLCMWGSRYRGEVKESIEACKVPNDWSFWELFLRYSMLYPLRLEAERPTLLKWFREPNKNNNNIFSKEKMGGKGMTLDAWHDRLANMHVDIYSSIVPQVRSHRRSSIDPRWQAFWRSARCFTPGDAK